MNKLQKQGDNFVLICGDESFACTVITEAKTGRDYVKLPKDNPSGRTFVSVTKFENTDVVEFDTKTEHRTGLTGGGWRSKLTPEEVTELSQLESRIAEIKTEAAKRETPKIDKNSEEGIEAEIAKLKAKLEAKRAAQSAPDAPKASKSKKAGK